MADSPGGHGHGPRIGSAAALHVRPLTIAFGLTASYMVIEFVAGFLTNSLALLSDAAHMATDVVGLGMALAAIQLAAHRRSSQHTYGLYRLEVLAALLNAVLLFGVGIYIFVEATRRFSDPPEIAGLQVALVAVVGLVVNVISLRLLRAGAKESLNVRAASLEVAVDALGSVGVLAAGAIQATTGWRYADPIIAVGIGLLVVPRTFRLLRQALRILLEAAPPGVDVAAAQRDLEALPGVTAVHDLHIWTVTDGIESASVHVVIAEDTDWHGVLDASRDLLATSYGVTHPTIQVEPHDHEETPCQV
ncbi:MAG: cation diffusion facilitator family transporter [Sporichthyaceae bacterium]